MGDIQHTMGKQHEHWGKRLQHKKQHSSAVNEHQVETGHCMDWDSR